MADLIDCPECGQTVYGEWGESCPNCGNKVERERVCSKCGTKIDGAWAFCPKCATPVSNQVQKNIGDDDGFFTDPRDGQRYRTVKIGNQVWMAENLNFKIAGSCCYNNDESNARKYGQFYPWDMAKKACPAGWHLPTDEDWDDLMIAIGSERKEDDKCRYYWRGAGKKLKSKTGWNEYEGQSGNGTDDYGFSALPGGGSNDSILISGAGSYGRWWSASEYDSCSAWYRNMDSNKDYVSRGHYLKTDRRSVRCVRDL